MALVKLIILILSVVFISLGWNTLDMMMWHPHREHPWLLPEGLWNMGPFWMSEWWAYFLFGILSYGVGAFLLGWVTKAIKEVKK